MQSQDLVLLVRPPAPSQPACGTGEAALPAESQGRAGLCAALSLEPPVFKEADDCFSWR